MNLTTATPREIDTELARLDGEYAKLGGQREGKIERARLLNDERPRYVGRKRKEWPTTVEEMLNELALKIAGEQLAPYDMPNAVKVIEEIDALDKAIAANRAACEPLEAEYSRRPWARFFLVQGGHIHSGMWCQGGSIRWDTVRGWQPELSDADVPAVVAKLGPLLCTKCFPSAPVEYTQGVQKPVDDTYCTNRQPVPGSYNPRLYQVRGTCGECGATKVSIIKQGMNLRKHKRPAK